MKNRGEIKDIGLATYWVPIKMVVPDRVWFLRGGEKIALFLDGDIVHGEDDPWDLEVDETLRKRGWTVLRERYHAPISKKRLNEIIEKVKETLR